MQYMPFCRECAAPSFDPIQPYALAHYFTELEVLFACLQITDSQQQKNNACSYIDIKVEDDRRALSECDNTVASYRMWKTAVFRLYPSGKLSDSIACTSLRAYVLKTAARGIRIVGDWAEFYCTFNTQSSLLINSAKFSMLDQNRWCANAIGLKTMKLLAMCLLVKYPNTHPSDGYTFAMLDEAMHWQL